MAQQKETKNLQDFQDLAKRETLRFAREHINDDTARLLLSAARYPSIDMSLAVQQIEGLRSAQEKWPTLLENEEFLYPPRLNREQASSEETAAHKVRLIASAMTVADLTGGMGIDSIAFASVATQVDYVELDPTLCTLMEHNCRTLGINNIAVHCTDSMTWLEGQEGFDAIYIDPARRGAAGRKMAAFEDCTPDILQHLDLLQRKCRRLMVKASPMIDLHRAITQLCTVTEVHIVALRGECKEVLFLCGESAGEPTIHCTNIKEEGTQDFSFLVSEEQRTEETYSDTVGHYLYDPHAALRKGGCFRLLGQRLGLPLLAPNTHLYTSNTLIDDFPGRTFEVLQEIPLNPKQLKSSLPDGRAHVVTRNFPTEAATLQKQMGLREGGDRFVIASTIGNRRTAFLCKII